MKGLSVLSEYPVDLDAQADRDRKPALVELQAGGRAGKHMDKARLEHGDVLSRIVFLKHMNVPGFLWFLFGGVNTT